MAEDTIYKQNAEAVKRVLDEVKNYKDLYEMDPTFTDEDFDAFAKADEESVEEALNTFNFTTDKDGKRFYMPSDEEDLDSAKKPAAMGVVIDQVLGYLANETDMEGVIEGPFEYAPGVVVSGKVGDEEVGKGSTLLEEMTKVKISDTMIHEIEKVRKEDLASIRDDYINTLKDDESDYQALETTATKYFAKLEEEKGVALPGHDDAEERANYFKDLFKNAYRVNSPLTSTMGAHLSNTLEWLIEEAGNDVAEAFAANAREMYHEMSTFGADKFLSHGKEKITASKNLPKRTTKKKRQQVHQEIVQFYGLESDEAQRLKESIIVEDYPKLLQEHAVVGAERGIYYKRSKDNERYRDLARDFKDKARNWMYGTIGAGILATCALIGYCNETEHPVFIEPIPQGEVQKERKVGPKGFSITVPKPVPTLPVLISTEEINDVNTFLREKGPQELQKPCYPTGLEQLHARMPKPPSERKQFADILNKAGACEGSDANPEETTFIMEE